MSKEPIISRVVNAGHLPIPTIIPSPFRHRQAARITSASISVIFIPLDQSPGTNPFIYAAEKAGRSTLLCVLCPIFRGHQPLLWNVVDVIVTSSDLMEM